MLPLLAVAVLYLSIACVFLGIQSQIVVMVTSDTAKDSSY